MKTNITKMIGLMALTGAVSSAAFASVTPEVRELENRFDEASMPTVKDLRGAYIGRCFPLSDLDSGTEGAMLIGKNVADENGPGIGGASNVNFRVVLDEPYAFDDFNADKDLLPAGEFPARPARAKDGAYSLLVGSFGAWSGEWVVRKSGDQLIALQYNVKPRRNEARRLDLWRACYFFKKVI